MNRARDTDNIEQCKLIGRETVGALFVTDNRGITTILFVYYINWFTHSSPYVFKRISLIYCAEFIIFLDFRALIDRGMFAILVYRLTVFTADFRSTLHRLYYL